jgi:hypothetical protein
MICKRISFRKLYKNRYKGEIQRLETALILFLSLKGYNFIIVISQTILS